MKSFIKDVKDWLNGLLGKKEKITFAGIASGFSAMIDSLKELEKQSNSELKEISGEQKILDERKDFAQIELVNATETAKNIKKLIPALDK